MADDYGRETVMHELYLQSSQNFTDHTMSLQQATEEQIAVDYGTSTMNHSVKYDVIKCEDLTLSTGQAQATENDSSKQETILEQAEDISLNEPKDFSGYTNGINHTFNKINEQDLWSKSLAISNEINFQKYMPENLQKDENSLSSSKSDEAGKVATPCDKFGFPSMPRAPYQCRKCRAHGRSSAVKEHKKNCPFNKCDCYPCKLVNNGRSIVARQIALYREQRNGNKTERVTNSRVKKINKLNLSTAEPSTFNETIPNEAQDVRKSESPPKEDSNPHCRRCRNHGINQFWRGHKKICPFKDCYCTQCSLIAQRKENEKSLRSFNSQPEKTIADELKPFMEQEHDIYSDAMVLGNPLQSAQPFQVYMEPPNRIIQPSNISQVVVGQRRPNELESFVPMYLGEEYAAEQYQLAQEEDYDSMEQRVAFAASMAAVMIHKKQANQNAATLMDSARTTELPCITHMGDAHLPTTCYNHINFDPGAQGLPMTQMPFESVNNFHISGGHHQSVNGSGQQFAYATAYANPMQSNVHIMPASPQNLSSNLPETVHI